MVFPPVHRYWKHLKLEQVTRLITFVLPMLTTMTSSRNHLIFGKLLFAVTSFLNNSEKIGIFTLTGKTIIFRFSKFIKIAKRPISSVVKYDSLIRLLRRRLVLGQHHVSGNVIVTLSPGIVFSALIVPPWFRIID